MEKSVVGVSRITKILVKTDAKIKSYDGLDKQYHTMQLKCQAYDDIHRLMERL